MSKHQESLIMPPTDYLTWIYGDEPFLIEDAFLKIRQEWPESRSFSDEVNLDVLTEACFYQDLFISQQMLVLRNPSFLYKSVSDSDLDRLQKLFLDPERQNPIVIVCTNKVDMRKKLPGWLKKQAKNYDCVGFKEWEQEKLVQWVIERGKLLGKIVELPAALILVELGGTHLQMIASELDKLSIYVGGKDFITVEDVNQVSAGAAGRTWQFTESLKTKNLPSLLQSISRLLEQGEDPIKLLGLMAASIRLYLQLKYGVSQNLSVASLAQTLGKNPFFLKQLLPTIHSKHSLDALLLSLKKLSETDVLIKSGRLQSRLGLELAAIHYCTGGAA